MHFPQEGAEEVLGTKPMAVPRPKRKKPAADKKLVAPIPLDASGRPIFPITLPGCKVHSLGEIVTDRAGFHSEESIYPVGYCSSRIYASVLNVHTSCIYTCTIFDAGTGPKVTVRGSVELPNLRPVYAEESKVEGAGQCETPKKRNHVVACFHSVRPALIFGLLPNLGTK